MASSSGSPIALKTDQVRFVVIAALLYSHATFLVDGSEEIVKARGRRFPRPRPRSVRPHVEAFVGSYRRCFLGHFIGVGFSIVK